MTVVAGCEDTSYDCPGSDKDGNRNANLDPLVHRFFRVGGADVASGSVVVGITRAKRRATINSIVAGHDASRESVTRVFGRVREKGKRKRKRKERETRVREETREKSKVKQGGRQRHRNALNLT